MQFKIDKSSDKRDNHIILFDDNKVLTEKFLQEKFEQDDVKTFCLSNEMGSTWYYKLADNAEKNRKLANSAFNSIKKQKAFSISIQSLSKNDYAFLEGFLLSTYTFDKYKSEKQTDTLSILYNGLLTDKNLNELTITTQANHLARTLVNEPQNYLTATQYSKDLEKLSKEAGFSFQYFDKDKIEELGMGGLLAVNKGSVEPPTFNILEWKPKHAKNNKPIVLVGKGVVYDTGGLSLKPTPKSMDFMKADMGGSATVVGALYAISKLKLNVHVVGLIAATDNRPSLNAYAPGDVITMYSGKTVEVLNTDAEGRLTLADALHYAKQYKPELVLDFATLTGAASRALAGIGIVAMGNADETVKSKLMQAGNNTHERLVEFPLWEEYGEMLKSDIADLKNLGGAGAGMITAGKFLEHFTDYPWMHFDIAGAAYSHTPNSYKGKGGTGIGVRLLIEFLKNY